MPYLKKMPNGKWRCQYRVDGKTRCVTAETKKEAEYMALEDQLATKRKKKIGDTIGEAVRKYIDSRANVLSPSTIQGYERMFKADLQPIANVYVKKFDNKAYQKFVNELSLKKTRRGTQITPKAVGNICGLLQAAIKWSDPDIQLEAKLPAPRKQIVELLPPDKVISIVKGTVIELPALLACWLSLAMSEIRGLTYESVRDGYLYVQGAMVDIDGTPVHKDSNKAYDRTRVLRIPKHIMGLIKATDAWKNKSGYLVPMSGRMIYKHWVTLQKKAGVVSPMTFHQLRHLFASVSLDLGNPDIFTMQHGGWSNTRVMKGRYQHVLPNKEDVYADRMDEYYESLINVENKVEN